MNLEARERWEGYCSSRGRVCSFWFLATCESTWQSRERLPEERIEDQRMAAECTNPETGSQNGNPRS